MNLNYLIGRSIYAIENLLYKIPFLSKRLPFGRNWIYDIKRTYKDMHLVFDVGANVGNVSLEINQYFPNAVIHAFEPIKNTFEILKNNVANKTNIIPVHKALGDTNEILKIQLSNHHTINSLINTSDGADSQLIEVIRGDDYMKSKNLSNIDIIKIDVEGFELKVLKGFKNSLASTKLIYVEFGFANSDNFHTFLPEIMAYLNDFNFEFIGIYELGRDRDYKINCQYGNALFKNKNIL